eukprot:jgi/Mesvir1/27994/Mv20192-RA.1
MANQSAKKRIAENKKHLQKLAVFIIAANAVYFVLRLLVFGASTSWWHWVALAVCGAAYHFCYSGIRYMAEPAYDEQGALIDGGSDLNMGGLLEYYHDIIYILGGVQIASVVSDKFWLLALVIPAFAGYKLWTMVLYPYVFARRQGDDAGGGESPRSRRRREKAERKAAQPKYTAVRRR